MTTNTVTFAIEGMAKRRSVLLNVTVHNQFNFDGVWLRGNLHCHVGGAERVASALDWYRSHGFDFLAATDHDAVTPIPYHGNDEFISIPGAELSSAHVVGIGIAEVPPREPASGEGIARLVEAVEIQGGLAILAHPHWSGWRWDDLRMAAEAGIAGFEVSNALCRRINGKGRAEQLWEMLLKDGFVISAIGSDDAHSLTQQGIGEAWTGVLASERSADAVLKAIRAGRTYASEGPQIKSITWEQPGAVVVECSPSVVCHFCSEGGGARSVFANNSCGLAKRFELNLSTEGYRIRNRLRIVLEDERGRYAWSSPMTVNVSMKDS